MKRKVQGKISSEEYFERKKLVREIKENGIGEKLVQDLSWLGKFIVNDQWERYRSAILKLIENKLVKEKLWHRNNDKCLFPLENGVPIYVKAQSYKAESEAEKEDEDTPEDELDSDPEEKEPEIIDPYEPENTDEIYSRGEIAGEFFEEEQDEENPIISHEEFEEKDGEEFKAQDDDENNQKDEDEILLFLPRLAVPRSNQLMRRYPRNLKEALARELIESKRYIHKFPRNLRPALCFFEIGQTDCECTFIYVRFKAYRHTKFLKDGKEFYLPEYKKDLLRLFHILKREKERYFLHNPFLRKALIANGDSPKKVLTTFWERFEAVYRGLTPKQRNALNFVYIKRRAQVDVAETMGIALDSLRDRLKGAKKKFRNAFPELAGFKPSKTYKDSKKRNYLYNGLLDKRDRKKKHPLFRIDPKTGEKTQIPHLTMKEKEGVNVAAIKAWARESSPVPDFSFTDYFTRLASQGSLDRREISDAVHDKWWPSYTERAAAHSERNPDRQDSEEEE